MLSQEISSKRYFARWNYYRRVFGAYLTNRISHLSFWHEIPEVNSNLRVDELGEYYMSFFQKADYSGDYDNRGIPLLNYQGAVGLQYNPIAISQYGLGNYNLFLRTGSKERYQKFLKIAHWLVENLEVNENGVYVWNHHFDWEYRDKLRAPWYSALAQGQGISLLVRAYQETKIRHYSDAAEKAFFSFLKEVDEGGVKYMDEDGYVWFEEAIVDPPTHILNGFIWASWGIYDYFLLTGDKSAKNLFNEAVETLRNKLVEFDIGFWSLYEQSGTRLKMIASPFYHSLHIVQLKIMYKLTGDPIFLHYAQKWTDYQKSKIRRNFALICKIAFKLLYY